jgi:LmbE family N-acetylglucosaminyl deacetylase
MRSRVGVTLGLIACAMAWLGGQGPARLPPDTGAAATWHWLQKLATTASLMHTTAHPDDEHGGMLTLASRGLGARVSLLTLTRGEAGDNALGPQLFDALGLIRTEELAVSNRYYGVDQQYFTSVVDYGFSKRLEEAFDKWGREHVLRDMVRIIRTERPLVIVSRFQGNARDGHGNHQTAGLLTQQAFEAAANPTMFPEQIAEGLRPWQARKLYIGSVRQNEAWHVSLDTGRVDPWLGDSYENVARTGLSFQRSQNGGRLVRVEGIPTVSLYRRSDRGAAPDVRETGFFEGLDTTVTGLFRLLGTPEPPAAAALLRPIDEAVREAQRTFDGRDPSGVASSLARGLSAARAAHDALIGDPDAALMLARKIDQFQAAIAGALGVELTAVAQPERGAETATSSAVAQPRVMGAVVPGQRFEVSVSLSSARAARMEDRQVSLDLDTGWTIEANTSTEWDPVIPPPAGFIPPLAHGWVVRASADVAISTRPYFSRASLRESRYDLRGTAWFGAPFTPPPVVAVARYRVDGVPVELRAPVRRREARLPYGYVLRELRAVPVVSLTHSPPTAVVPLAAPRPQVRIAVEILNNREAGTTGEVKLRMPAGWTAEPASAPFAFARAGERGTFTFTLVPAAIENRLYDVTAVATVDGREYAEGFEELEFRDLETRYLYRPSTVAVRGVDVSVVPGLKVGYVMGIGDQVPTGIRQLGYDVTLLDERALATGDLHQYDTIMTGTRAYAVRADLRTYNARLLDYARNGGNLVVLYNTQEMVPNQYAPFPGELTARAEEVSEEDSPVEFLAANAPMMTAPNRITPADFDGWVEQRGSKFWSAWDAAYTPIISTFDQGQAPQRGGWLWARVGKGHYTYFAYAFHRQLPYGVPGAYRLLANVLALGRSAR